ncbi:hypothetical protein AMTR_s00074p00185380 [Amborella trichopoda]|uniref:Uncharacterized protein n=1 Tax=Amborella trichopoda TaxID=13333 RepID=W1NQC1_AMBTC|nr:hypothetical protein AMTR_s00074p00185380 [Amborella trichopoda]
MQNHCPNRLLGPIDWGNVDIVGEGGIVNAYIVGEDEQDDLTKLLNNLEVENDRRDEAEDVDEDEVEDDDKDEMEDEATNDEDEV